MQKLHFRLPSVAEKAVKVSSVPYINCSHYQKSECENLPLSFLRLYSVVCFLIIRLDSIKFAPHDQAVEEDQDLKRRTNKKYHEKLNKEYCWFSVSRHSK